MRKSESPKPPGGGRKTALSYRCLPNWLVSSVFVASLLSFGLLAFQLSGIGDTNILFSLYRISHTLEERSSLASPAERYRIEHSFTAGGNSSFVRPLRYNRLRISPPNNREVGDLFYRTAWSNDELRRRQEQRAADFAAQAQDRLVYSQRLSEQRIILADSLLLVVSSMLLLLGLRMKDRSLIADQNGIRFPSGMMANLAFRQKRTWNDLNAIGLSRQDGAKLQLFFASGGKASLSTNRLDQKSLGQLFSSLDLYAPHAQRSPEVIIFQQDLFKKEKDSSFTQLWEEELHSRFAATNFVTLSPGSQLQNGQIKIAMHISSGGLSAVYLAERSNGMVVVKESVVPEGTSEESRAKAKEMFAREAGMLMKLNHSRIATVLDFFQENNRDYLLLEYIPGITLREYVRRHGPQSEEQVESWAKQIASILGYLHKQDPPVIHRDLTPDNLMITPSGEIVLIDFGAANQYLGTATGTIVGKQFYISPEQFRGKATPASDIYSLGGTMFFLLTGKDPEALSSSHPRNETRLISQKMDALVSKCTSLSEGDRFTDADDLLQALQANHGETDNQMEDTEVISLKQIEKQYS